MECRSFQMRIRIAIGNTEPFRVATGFLYLESPNGYSYLNTRSLARNEHIRMFAPNLPSATPLDWKGHLESWDQGVEWVVRNLGSGSSSPDEHKALLASKLSYRRS